VCVWARGCECACAYFTVRTRSTNSASGFPTDDTPPHRRDDRSILYIIMFKKTFYFKFVRVLRDNDFTRSLRESEEGEQSLAEFGVELFFFYIDVKSHQIVARRLTDSYTERKI